MYEGETSPLYVASVQGEAATVRLLLAGGADPNLPSPGEDEGLPLCASASWGYGDVVEVLLAGGADPDRAEEYGWTALLWASANGHAEVVALLLAHGADANLCDQVGGTPLLRAADRGEPHVVRLLLEHGADVAATDFNGRTAIQVARRWAETDLEQELRREASLVAADGDEVRLVRKGRGDESDLLRAEVGGSVFEKHTGHRAIVVALENHDRA